MFPFSYLYTPLPPATTPPFPIVPSPSDGVYQFIHGIYDILALATDNTTTFMIDGMVYHISAGAANNHSATTTDITVDTPAESDCTIIGRAVSVGLWLIVMVFLHLCWVEGMASVKSIIMEGRLKRKVVVHEVRMVQVGAKKEEHDQGAKEQEEEHKPVAKEELEKDQGWCVV